MLSCLPRRARNQHNSVPVLQISEESLFQCFAVSFKVAGRYSIRLSSANHTLSTPYVASTLELSASSLNQVSSACGEEVKVKFRRRFNEYPIYFSFPQKLSSFNPAFRPDCTVYERLEACVRFLFELSRNNIS